MAKPSSAAIEVDTVQGRFRSNAREICKRVMNASIKAQKLPTENRPAIPKADDLQKILNIIEPDPANPITSEQIIELFFEASFSIWNSIFVKDQATLMGVIGKLIPNVSATTIASYQNLLLLKNNDNTMIIDTDEIALFWKYFQMMVRQCIDYGLQKCGNKERVAITKTFSLTKKELEELKKKWEITKETSKALVPVSTASTEPPKKTVKP